MKNERSDIWMIIFCSVPVLLGALLFVDYQATGRLPFPVPTFGITSISLPSLPSIDAIEPPALHNFFLLFRDHVALAVAASTVGLLMLVTLIGMWSDFALTRRAALAHSAAESRVAVDHPLDAPWLELDQRGQ